MFNLAGMLSYNLMLSVFPLLILSISLLGIIFQHSTAACSASHFEGQLITNLASFLPSQITSAHRERGGATSLPRFARRSATIRGRWPLSASSPASDLARAPLSN
jgi:hypothetical protein